MANPAIIMIIDDDKDLCELLGDYLKAEGFEVTAVHNGFDGAEQAARSGLEVDGQVLDLEQGHGVSSA